MTLAHDLGRGNRAANRSAVKLQEIGPRITMQLIKVEEGLCSGKVMFHEFGECCLRCGCGSSVCYDFCLGRRRVWSSEKDSSLYRDRSCSDRTLD